MLLRGRRGAWRLGRRGAVSVIFACALPMLIIAVGIGVDFSRIADARAALQRAVDNAALSGAAAYVLYTQGDAYNAVAVSTAKAAFCKASVTLPAGATLAAPPAGASTDSTGCDGNGGPGPGITSAIGGYVPGTRGAAANTGCSATNPVVPGVTCGFLVTVAANATITPAFSGLLGGAQTVTATATAANPFLDLGSALAVQLQPSTAASADSIWVYPLLLDANGNPDFVSDQAARPSRKDSNGNDLCTGAPNEIKCGSYTMLASTFFQGRACTPTDQSAACETTDGTPFPGSDGVVKNPQVSAAVITATTPLGFAFEATNGGNKPYNVNGGGSNPKITLPKPSDGCSWPAVTSYHTWTQVYAPVTDNSGPAQNVYKGLLSAALVGKRADSSIDWRPTTHWFYSSFLANPATSYPPDQDEIGRQLTVQSMPTANPSTSCNDPEKDHYSLSTTYPTTGATNCSLYIVKDPPTPIQENTSYKNSSVCWAPASTPGRQYAALSCQGFAGHTFAFFWNNMVGLEGGVPKLSEGDDTNYADGTAIVRCSGASTVQLIN